MDFDKVVVVDYNKDWPQIFEREATNIKSQLNQSIQAIYHIGSTAIPGLLAKEVIDILLVVFDLKDIEHIKSKLLSLGYGELCRSIIPHQSYITFKITNNMRYHCHIFEIGDPQISRHLRFRDYLIMHPEQATAYADLKQRLAQSCNDNIRQYFLGKNKFVQEIDAKAKQWSLTTKKVSYYSNPNYGKPIGAWSKEKLVQAIEANLIIQKTHFAQFMPSMNFIRCPGYVLVNSGLAMQDLNLVLDTHFSYKDIDIGINEIINNFKEKNAPFTWWISPCNEPNDLLQRLKTAGLSNCEEFTGMYIDLDKWQTPFKQSNYLIKRIKDKASFQVIIGELPAQYKILGDYLQLVANIYNDDDDPIKFYAIYENDNLISFYTLGLYAQIGCIINIFNIITENTSIAVNAILSLLLDRIKKYGYHVAGLLADNDLAALLQKQGFKDCGIFKLVRS